MHIYHQLPPMASLGPIHFPKAATDTLGWAHAYQSATSADGFAWTHSFPHSCCRRPWMGPLHLQLLLLPMASYGPLLFQNVLPMP